MPEGDERRAAAGRRGEPRSKPGGRAEAEASPRRACCMISELLEESGFDRAKARLLKRQVLEGLILLARWQLERMDGRDAGPSSTRRGGARKVAVE